MEFVIVTGMSGAGKTQAMHALEDIGFYCVDNLPTEIIPVFYDLCEKSPGLQDRIAVVTDIRGGDLFKSFFSTIEQLRDSGKHCKILFLDCSNRMLISRYKETRRRHPLVNDLSGSLEDAVALERVLLKHAKERADYVIDTTGVSPTQLRFRVKKLFSGENDKSLTVHCISFGYRNGIPPESDLVFDVRCLPNPYHVLELRPLTGLDKPIIDFVMESPETKGFVEKFTDMIDFLLPLYIKEGKSQLVISVGCTGGHHRSVALAQYMSDHTSSKGYKSSVTHRDINKKDVQ